MPIRSPHRPHVIGTVAIETFYQETPPHTCTPRSADPVYNHGQQLRDSHAYQRRQYESQELLGKVFTSWQSRKGGESAPVNSATIDNLKRRARLLHYCTSPLLLQQSLLSTADTQVSSLCSVSAMSAIAGARASQNSSPSPRDRTSRLPGLTPSERVSSPSTSSICSLWVSRPSTNALLLSPVDRRLVVAPPHGRPSPSLPHSCTSVSSGHGPEASS